MARTKEFDECEVLVKAVDVFWLKGYNGTSMQDLVDGLGISRSSLYDTFGDKHSLYMRALESYQCQNYSKINQIIDSGLSAKETIKQLLQYIVNGLLGDSAQKGCFLVNAEVEVGSHDEAVSKVICQNDQRVEESFYQVIKKGQDSGEITNTQDARALVRFISNTVKGIQVTIKSTNDKAVFDDIIKLAVSVLD